jgi:hypothetical protein
LREAEVPRSTVFEVITDTTYFNPLQLQPRVLLSLSFNAMSRWLKEHLVSFPELIQKYRTSLVILGAGIRYEEPLSFFDGDSIEVRAALRVLRKRSRAELNVAFAAGQGTAASVRILLCPVHIVDPISLAAAPRELSDDLVSRLQDDELDAASPARPLLHLQRGMESAGQELARATSSFVTHRHLCEVADQWAFLEVAGLVGAGREAMALNRGTEVPGLVDALARPLSSFEMELTRPYFWFQPGFIDTTAFRWEDRLAFVHSLRSPVPGGDVHGIAVERF